MSQPYAKKIGTRKVARPDSVNAIYELSEPTQETWGDHGLPARFVWVSAVPHAGSFEGPETYIFPCTEDGEILDWLEMGGSFKGEMNHERALAELAPGYQIREIE